MLDESVQYIQVLIFIMQRLSHNNIGSNTRQKQRKTHRFYLGSRERYIVIDSDFDSGNIECIKQLSDFNYRLSSVLDNHSTEYATTSRSWFYFSATGFPNNTRGRFSIENIHTLMSIYNSKNVKAYRPVYKVGDGEWLRLPTEATLILRENGILEVNFEYLFNKETDVVYFAFCYPHSYEDNIRHVQMLGEYLYIDDFYYHQELLTYSAQRREVHLLTITSHDEKKEQKEQIFDPLLFPHCDRPFRFDKPVVVITARVHPGETPSSFAMTGITKFLTDKRDLRAFLLRKMFVFMIVPMINVDGVSNGFFRMDTLGQNLNRHYSAPEFQLQPAVYAIKKLAEHLHKTNRLSFYFDLHAHNTSKGCFIYGNAINDFVDQVESQVFCKLFAMNTKLFQYESCNFSVKHMKAKDRNQLLTKEGSGRVVMHKLTNVIHAYSLQCGLLKSNQLNLLPAPSNTTFTVGSLMFKQDPIEDNNNPLYSLQQPPFYTPEMYENVGKALLVSILDTFDKNPYSRVNESEHKTMKMLRRTTAFEVFHEAQRFRMFERFTFSKVKHINELMVDNFKVKFNHKKIFNFADNPVLRNVLWPTNIPGLHNENRTPNDDKKIQRKNQNVYTAANEEDELLFSDLLTKMRDQISTNIEATRQHTFPSIKEEHGSFIKEQEILSVRTRQLFSKESAKTSNKLKQALSEARHHPVQTKQCYIKTTNFCELSSLENKRSIKNNLPNIVIANKQCIATNNIFPPQSKRRRIQTRKKKTYSILTKKFNDQINRKKIQSVEKTLFLQQGQSSLPEIGHNEAFNGIYSFGGTFVVDQCPQDQEMLRPTNKYRQLLRKATQSRY